MTAAVNKHRPRDRQATEEALIAAAGAEFAEKGYENATTRGIADAAGCSEGLIQRYFNGKEGLLLAVLKQDNEEELHRDRFVDLPLLPSIVDEARVMLTNGVESLARKSERIRIVMSRVLLDPNFQSDFKRISVRSAIAADIEARLGRYADAGMLDPSVDLGLVTEYLMSLTFQLGFIHRVVFQTDSSEILRMIDLFAVLFARGVTASTAEEG